MLTFFPTALTDLFTHVVVYPSIIHLLCVEAIPASASFCDDLEKETQPLTFRCYGQWGKHSDRDKSTVMWQVRGSERWMLAFQGQAVLYKLIICVWIICLTPLKSLETGQNST